MLEDDEESLQLKTSLLAAKTEVISLHGGQPWRLPDPKPYYDLCGREPLDWTSREGVNKTSAGF